MSQLPEWTNRYCNCLICIFDQCKCITPIGVDLRLLYVQEIVAIFYEVVPERKSHPWQSKNPQRRSLQCRVCGCFLSDGAETAWYRDSKQMHALMQHTAFKCGEGYKVCKEQPEAARAYAVGWLAINGLTYTLSGG